MSISALKGIVIVAVGHPYYGRMAYNLCLSIKNVEDFPVTVIQSQNSLAHLSFDQKQVFDNVINLPADAPIGCGAKLWADLVSPYEKTLVLDADMLWLPNKKPSDLFETLDCDFTSITEGYHPDNLHPKYFLWAIPEEIKEKYPIKSEKLYQWRSEVMYFTKAAAPIFDIARGVFLKPNLNSEQKYAGGTADELGLVVACGMLDIHPHLYKWMPAYWHLMNGGEIPDFSYLYNNYYLASFGANYASSNSKKLYDRLMRVTCYNRGTQHVFPLVSKKDFLPERAKM